jgi:D-glucosaminate-6-phosphate ammonia-lyase
MHQGPDHVSIGTGIGSGGARMLHALKNSLERGWGSLSRRELFLKGSWLGLPALLRRASPAAPATSGELRIGPEIYQSIGVRPIINCRGTLTVVGGSLELPEVRAAKEAAAQHFVQLDEMMEGIGKRLAELTGAEWGMVTSGCAAALAHATAACVTGGNPDLHVRVPNLAGFAKDEVVIPRHSRNVYDAAVRSVGVRIIEVGDVQEYEAALGPKVAMVYVFAGPGAESGPLPYDDIYRIAKQRGIPVLVDAAAEMLTVPNVHLQRGAALVGYSGGKCIRGPQCAGILLGRKDLVKAAWVVSAPHHGHGRAMKVGKEEAMGMLMAVEMWMKRDHKAEMEMWTSWMNHIANRVSRIDGVRAVVKQPAGLSNHSPGLTISWDAARLGITGEEVSQILFTTEPRIALGAGGGFGSGARRASGETSISITAYMMSPGEDKIVADRICSMLSMPRPAKTKEPLKPPAGDLTGRWDVRIEFAAGASDHSLYLKQEGNRIEGTHQGDFIARDMFGTIEGDEVRVASVVTESHGDALSYHFSGKLSRDAMSGTLDMGEYLTAKWTARRHPYGRRA